jgi:hypothetical protein
MKPKCPTCGDRSHVARWAASYPHPTSQAPAALFCMGCWQLELDATLNLCFGRGALSNPVSVAYWLRLQREGK